MVVDQILDLSDLRRTKLVFGCRRGLYLSIPLPTHHTNEVDIAYLCFLPFFPFFSLFTYFFHSFPAKSLGVSLSLVSVFVFSSLLTKKKLFCVLSLKALVVVGTGRVIGEGGGSGGGMGGLFNTFSFYLSSALSCSTRLIKLISSSFILFFSCKCFQILVPVSGGSKM